MHNISISLMLVTLFFTGAAIAAGDYPARAVRVVVPYPSGGGADFVARVFCKALSDKLGQQFFIDNRAGANGNVGSEIVAKSVPSGYTLLAVANTTVTINPSLYRQMPLDMLRDLAPVSIFASQPNVLLVHPSLPAKTAKELVVIAQSRPGALDYASAGPGSSSHIAAELFRMVTRINITHVPYKGNGPALAGLLSGQIPMMFNNLAPSVSQVKSGRLRALAVTGEKRSPAAPEVPTMAESGYSGALFILWVGMLAPAGTPLDIVTKLNAEIVAVSKLPEVRERLALEGTEAYVTSPSQMTEVLRTEMVKWAKVVKAANITSQ